MEIEAFSVLIGLLIGFGVTFGLMVLMDIKNGEFPFFKGKNKIEVVKYIQDDYDNKSWKG